MRRAQQGLRFLGLADAAAQARTLAHQQARKAGNEHAGGEQRADIRQAALFEARQGGGAADAYHGQQRVARQLVVAVDA